jgi:chemotaxis signal transduction protein
MNPSAAHMMTAEQLRRAFDEAFTRAPEERASDDEDVLAVRLGNDPYAIRLIDIAGVHLGQKVVPLPSPMSELSGVAALRGVLVPIYDLAALLGYPATSGQRGFVLARVQRPVGFACGVPERLVRLPRSAFAGAADAQEQRPHLSGLVRVYDTLRPVIDIASIVQTVERAIVMKARSGE